MSTTPMSTTPMSETPELDRLQLPAADRQALDTNGFVSEERRGARRQFKLRYRVAGVQCVRALGSDPERAEQIQQELRRCQRARDRTRLVRQLVREARLALRTAKQHIAPHVVAAGYAFHGRTIRRPRGAKQSAPQSETKRPAERFKAPRNNEGMTNPSRF